MNDSSKNWPGVFGGLRVPFDFKVIFLGFISIVIFSAGLWVIDFFADEEYLVSRSLNHLFSSLGETSNKGFQIVYSIFPGHKAPADLLQKTPDCKAMIALSIWSLIIFTIFGGAIARLSAYRVAKDESISIKKALKFAFKHKITLLFTPFLIALTIGFFYGCNWVAGFLAKTIPTAGPIIFIPVFLLVLISTIFMILLVIGLLFGFHLIPCSIAAEGCDASESVISVFACIFSRPWSYIVYQSLLIFSLIFLTWIGGVFIDLSFQSSLVSFDKVNLQTASGEKQAQIVSYKFHPQWKTVDVNYRFLDSTLPPQQIKYYLDNK